MKYFFKIAKIIYSVFLIFSMVFFFVIVAKIKIPDSLAQHLILLYLVTLFVTMAVVIPNIVLAFLNAVKMSGLLKTLMKTIVLFIAGLAIAVIMSLIRYKTFFSLNYLYIPFCFSVFFLPLFFYQGKEK